MWPDLETLRWQTRLWFAWLWNTARDLGHRPLLAMAASVLGGCALGSSWLRPRLFPDGSSPQRVWPCLDTPLQCALALTLLALCLQLRRAASRTQGPQDKQFQNNKPMRGAEKLNRLASNHSASKRHASDLAVMSALFASLIGGCAVLSARRSVPPPGDVSLFVRDFVRDAERKSHIASAAFEPAAFENDTRNDVMANTLEAQHQAQHPFGPQRRLEVSLDGWIAASPRAGEFATEFPLQCARIALPRRSTRIAMATRQIGDNTLSNNARSDNSGSTSKKDSLGSDQNANHLAANASDLAKARYIQTQGQPKRGEKSNATAFDWHRTEGRIWVRVPPNVRLDVGDRVVMRAEFADLRRAGNPGERTSAARFISDGCWSQARVRDAGALRVVARGQRFALQRRLAAWRQNLLAHYTAAFAPHEYSWRTPMAQAANAQGANAQAANARDSMDEKNSAPNARPQGLPYARATAQLLTAMVFGEGGLREPLPHLTRERFRAAGLSHLLVASGTQVSFCALLLLGLARGLGLRRVWLLLFVVPPLLLYALIAGGQASIWRATVGGACLAWALLEGRDTDGLSLWSLALCALLLLDPAQASDLGFQLTFAATWGLLVLAPGLRRLLHHTMGVKNNTTRNNTTREENARDDSGGDVSRDVNGASLSGSHFWLDLAALSLAAQLATAPLLLYHFGRLSVAGIGANFIGVPLAAMLVATGLAGLLWAPVNTLSYALVRVLDLAAGWAAQAPGAQTTRPPLPLGWTLFCYALLACALARYAWTQYLPQLLAQQAANDLMRNDLTNDASADATSASHMSTHVARLRLEAARRRRLRKDGWRWQSLFVGALLMAACAQAWRTWARHSAVLRVSVLDVGQGESILVESPNGRAVLIDGGTIANENRGEVGLAVIVPYLQARGIKRLDALVLTHADSDHSNALAAVVREVPVDLALDGAAAREELEGAANTFPNAKLPSAMPSAMMVESNADVGALSDYERLRVKWRERGIPVVAARAGQRLQLGDGVVLTVLAPLAPAMESQNNNCVVLRLEYGAVSFLLTGDIEREAEERLVRRGAELKCTVLKLAHHGSKTSTSPLFLQAADPQIAVVSCGRYNPFGHPAPTVVRALAARQVPLFRTDVQGAIEITSDGKQCWVQSFR